MSEVFLTGSRPGGRTTVLAALLIAVTSTAVGCGSEPGPLERFEEELTNVLANTSLALPEELPPGLEEAWVETVEGVTRVAFYSENAPVVTVCTGPVEKCLKATTDVELRVVQVESQEVVLSLGQQEEPADPPRLDGTLDEFWTDVSLTFDRPGWLNSD